jgi:hypothetical protein
LAKVAGAQAEKVGRDAGEEAFDRLARVGDIDAAQRCLEIEYETRRRDEEVACDQRFADAIAVRPFQANIGAYGAAAAGPRRAWSHMHRCRSPRETHAQPALPRTP